MTNFDKIIPILEKIIEDKEITISGLSESLQFSFRDVDRYIHVLYYSGVLEQNEIKNRKNRRKVYKFMGKKSLIRFMENYMGKDTLKFVNFYLKIKKQLGDKKMKPKPLDLEEFRKWRAKTNSDLIFSISQIEFTKQQIKSACEFYLMYRDSPRFFMEKHPEYVEELINKRIYYNNCLLYTSPSPRDS